MYNFSNGDSTVSVYHSKNLNVKKSKSHNEKLGKMDKSKQGRRYSSGEVASRRGEFGMPISNSFQEHLSKICETADPDEESTENIPPENDSDATEQIAEHGSSVFNVFLILYVCCCQL